MREWQQGFSFWVQFVQRFWAYWAIALLGLLSISSGGWVMFQAKFSPPPLTLLPERQHEATDSASLEEVVVDISGGVERPGVYRLSAGSRWQDAVLMAGGFSSQASIPLIHSNINLSKSIKDQDKIVIPIKNGGIDINTSIESSTKNLNSFTIKEIQNTFQLSEKRAGEIVDKMPYLSMADVKERGKVSQAFINTLISKNIEVK